MTDRSQAICSSLSAADADAVDARDGRLADVAQAIVHLDEGAHPAPVLAAGGAHRGLLVEVGAGAEGPVSRAGHDHHRAWCRPTRRPRRRVRARAASGSRRQLRTAGRAIVTVATAVAGPWRSGPARSQLAGSTGSGALGSAIGRSSRATKMVTPAPAKLRRSRALSAPGGGGDRLGQVLVAVEQHLRHQVEGGRPAGDSRRLGQSHATAALGSARRSGHGRRGNARRRPAGSSGWL